MKPMKEDIDAVILAVQEKQIEYAKSRRFVALAIEEALAHPQFRETAAEAIRALWARGWRRPSEKRT